MRRAARSPQLTGPDYLVALASSAAERGQPYAHQFALMVQQAFLPAMGPQVISDVIANRPLQDHEASPVAIISTAVQSALQNGDMESAVEALNVGLSLLAKWPHYLVASADGHPKLDYKAE